VFRPEVAVQHGVGLANRSIQQILAPRSQCVELV
jgi:hypothetical protein